MTSNHKEKFVVRFTEEGLRDQISAEARVSFRSMNAEILHRLFRSVELEAELKRANAVIDRLTGKDANDAGDD